MKFNKHLKNIQPYKLSFSRAKIHEKGVLKLDWNEATIPPSKKVISAIIDFLSRDNHLNWYPEVGSEKLVHELTKYTKISKEQILVTNGSDQAHELVCNAFLNENDEVFIPTPTYTNFTIWPQMKGAKNIFYEINIENPKFEELVNKINSKTTLIYLVNPYIIKIPQNIINEILEKGIPTIIDEAYFEFSNYSSINLLNKFDNLIITRSFSKALSFAGMRLGYICSSKKIINELKKIHNFKSVNVLAQIGGEQILKEKNYFKKYVKKVINSTKLIKSELDNSNFRLIATDSGFIILKHKKINSEKLSKLLEKNKIFVRDLTSKGMDGFVRLNLGTIEQTEELIRKLKKIDRAQ